MAAENGVTGSERIYLIGSFLDPYPAGRGRQLIFPAIFEAYRATPVIAGLLKGELQQQEVSRGAPFYKIPQFSSKDTTD
jgi:hypothetical protein